VVRRPTVEREHGAVEVGVAGGHPSEVELVLALPFALLVHIVTLAARTALHRGP
jgi:hypothetical protein